MKFARSAAVAAAFAASTFMVGPAAAQDTDAAAEARLDRTIDQAMKADGPWLLPEEQALIERKCGYPRGSRDSQSISMSGGVLVCESGRRVDDPEVREMMRIAGPRIAKRVHAVMDSPEVRNAITMVADGAVQRALASLRDERPRRNRRR